MRHHKLVYLLLFLILGLNNLKSDEILFQPKYYKISIDPNQPQLKKDPDHLIDNHYVYVIKGQILDQPIAIDPVGEVQNAFQNPFKVIGRYLVVARTANQDDILKLYDPDAIQYITKTFLADPAVAARFLKAISQCNGFKVKAIFQETNDLWLLVGYPIMNGQTNKYTMPFLLKEKNGDFMLSAGPGNLSTENLNIQSTIMLKGLEGLTYEVVDVPH